MTLVDASFSGSDWDVESGAAPFALELADPSADMFASNGTLAPRRRVSAHEHRVRPREWRLGRVSQTYPTGAALGRVWVQDLAV